MPHTPRAIICTLGLSRYTPVHYRWNGESFETPFVQEALVHLLPADMCYVLVTPEVADQALQRRMNEDKDDLQVGGGNDPATELSNLEDLQRRLGDRVVPVPIPSEQTPEKLWEVFNAVTQTWPEDTCVVLDVTNAFRYLPILLLAAAVYLRAARGFLVERIVYGRYEPGRPEAPINDITQFLDLIDWTIATDQFIKTGNAQTLAKGLPASASALAGNISGIAQGLHLLRPIDVMRSAGRLPATIAAAAPSVTHDVPPFAALLQRIETDYGAFALPKGDENRPEARDALVRELRMVEWYTRKQQYVHALSLAREWVVTLLCYHFKIEPLDKHNREDMEHLLGSPTWDRWNHVPHKERLVKLWGEPVNLRELRNDVLHAGFRHKKQRKSAASVIADTETVLVELKAVAEEWGLEGSNW